MELKVPSTSRNQGQGVSRRSVKNLDTYNLGKYGYKFSFLLLPTSPTPHNLLTHGKLQLQDK